MGVIVDRRKCNGCKGLEEPKCVRICPGDLMAIDEKTGKSYIREFSDCWDCMACVKACPRGALEVRLPYQIALYGGKLKPKVRKDSILWILKDNRGVEERFVIKTRTLELEREG
jgi:adenylylsulfate reductase subunit B